MNAKSNLEALANETVALSGIVFSYINACLVKCCFIRVFALGLSIFGIHRSQNFISYC